MQTNTDRIPNGTLVTLYDGSKATAYYDGGTYRTAQRNPITGGTRVDHGWRREQLQVIGMPCITPGCSYVDHPDHPVGHICPQP